MQSRNSRLLIAFLIVILMQTEAYAEPGGSSKHLPILWAIVVAGAVLSSIIPWIIRYFSKTKYSNWVYWVASIVLVIMFLIAFGPVIIALGNILLSGRTM